MHTTARCSSTREYVGGIPLRMRTGSSCPTVWRNGLSLVSGEHKKKERETMRRTTAAQLWGLALLWGLLVLRRHWEAPVMASMQRLLTALSVPMQPTGLPGAATRMWKRAHPFPPPRSANPASPAAAPSIVAALTATAVCGKPRTRLVLGAN